MNSIEEYYETLELVNADSDEFTRANNKLDALIERLTKSAALPEMVKRVGGSKKK